MAAKPVPPMFATSAVKLPAGPQWTYEVKWDGYRTMALKEGGRVKLLSRNLNDLTTQYSAIAEAVSHVRARAVLLDGEVVAVDDKGRPSFQALHHHASRHLAYYVFDLLHLNGRDLLTLPIEQRRALLPKVCAGTSIVISESLPGTPGQIERAVRRLQLEGVVAKRLGSRYEPGKRSAAWVKVKFNRRQEFVVGGFKPNAPSVESLLVGYYEGRKLYFAGKVRAGLTPHVRAALLPRIAALETDRCPFANLPSSRTSHWGEGMTEEDMAKCRWVRPRIVVEVSFVEWTRDGLLRHSQFAGVRDDKPARDVRREER